MTATIYDDEHDEAIELTDDEVERYYPDKKVNVVYTFKKDKLKKVTANGVELENIPFPN